MKIIDNAVWLDIENKVNLKLVFKDNLGKVVIIASMKPKVMTDRGKVVDDYEKEKFSKEGD